MKTKKPPANSQHIYADEDIAQLATAKQDVLDHYNKCRAIFPINGNSKVVE